MDTPESAEVKQERGALGIASILLDWHGLQGTFDLPDHHHHDISSRVGQPLVQQL
jgi:hypothetical protein